MITSETNFKHSLLFHFYEIILLRTEIRNAFLRYVLCGILKERWKAHKAIGFCLKLPNFWTYFKLNKMSNDDEIVDYNEEDHDDAGQEGKDDEHKDIKKWVYSKKLVSEAVIILKS